MAPFWIMALSARFDESFRVLQHDAIMSLSSLSICCTSSQDGIQAGQVIGEPDDFEGRDPFCFFQGRQERDICIDAAVQALQLR